MTMADRQCNRCATWYPPHLIARAFQPQRGRWDASNLRKTICRPCEQTARDQRKIRDRWAVKARDVIRRHALRLEVSKFDLISRYGWDPAKLAHEAEFQYGNGCSYCGHPYMDMGHGLADITLDIIDRGKPPYYRTNAKWCCQTCNRKKGATNPEEFELDRQVYETWNRAKSLTPDELGLLF
jgi:5-methylcytosine-specific restriction endonuclease McrA